MAFSSWSGAVQAIYLLDSKGLITNTRGDTLPDHKKYFCRDDGTPDMKVGTLPHPLPHSQG